MREVSKEEFYAPIYGRRLNVSPYIQPTPFPYTSIWKYQGALHGRVYGKTVDRVERGLVATSYFLAES